MKNPDNMKPQSSKEELDFQKKVKKEEKANLIKKGALGIMLSVSTIASGMDADASTKEYSTLDTNMNTLENVDQDTLEPDDSDVANPFGINLEDETLSENKPALETEPTDPEEKSENNSEVFEKMVDAGFDMGKVDISPEKSLEMQESFVTFLENLPQELKDKINSGEAKIVIHGGASHHVIDPEVGVDTGSQGKVFNNNDLAEFRAQAGVEIMKKGVFEKVSGLDKAEMIIDTHVYSEDEAETALEEGRQVRISIREVLDSAPAGIEITGFEDKEIFQNLPSGKVEKMYIDGSGSMKGKASKLYQALADAGYVDDPVKLQFGSGFGEISNEKIVSSSRDVEIFDRNVRSQEKFSNNEETFRNAEEILKKMPLVKYSDRTEESVKIVTFLTDEFLNVSTSTIKSL